MSDPRLTRLASLWRQGLESALSSADEAELRGLLQDAPLAEEWMEAQGGHQKAAALIPAGSMPRRLRSAFQRQFKPMTYWGLRLSLPALAVFAWLAWPRDQSPEVSIAVEEKASFAEEARRPAHKVEQADLGPPPGLDDRAHLWVKRSGKTLRFEVELQAPAKVQARVLDAGGQAVKTLDLGHKEAGKVPVAWDGTVTGGGRAPAGQYRVRVYVDGTLDTEKSWVVEKK